MLAVAGVTAIDVSAGAVTVKVEDPATVPEVAVMVVVPCARLVASPLLFTLATVAAVEVHLTELVNVFVVPSL